HLSGIDLRIQRRINTYESLALRIVQVDRIGGPAGIETVLHQVDLLLLEGPRHVIVFAYAQEHRPRIFGQVLRDMIAQRGQVEIVLGDDGGHAGATVAARNLHAVDIGLQNAVESTYCLLHLGGRDVLPFPTESIADAVDEIEIAVLVLAHQIAGSKPEIAFFEHVVQDLSVGLGVVRIALEPLAGFGRLLEDFADNLARFVDLAFDAETSLVADRLLGLRIKAHDLGWKRRGGPPGQPAHRALLAVEIEQRDVAFGRAVELDDLRDAEATLELRPDIGAQAVAAGQAQVMLALIGIRPRVDEITAKLADVLKAGAI